MKYRLIIYNATEAGITSTLVEFDNYAELLECTDIIDEIDSDDISYLGLQPSPKGIKQTHLPEIDYGD